MKASFTFFGNAAELVKNIAKASFWLIIVVGKENESCCGRKSKKVEVSCVVGCCIKLSFAKKRNAIVS